MFKLTAKQAKKELEKMKTKLESDDYKVKFWYERNNKNVPIITKCKVYKFGEDVTYFGASMWDKTEILSKNIGKMISLSRALKAMKRQETKYFEDGKKVEYGVFDYVPTKLNS